MKYFTPKLWEDFNSSNLEIRSEASKQWDINAQEYYRLFDTLQDRFSKKTFQILSKTSFHDLQLVNFRIIHGRYGLKYPVDVIITIGNREEEWDLIYKKVIKIQVDYQEDNQIEGGGFDDYGYDEFLPVDEDILSHEILFASDATILIHFYNKNLFIKKRKI